MASVLSRFLLGGLFLIAHGQLARGGTFTDPSGFSFSYPEGWVPMTRQGVADVKQAIPSGLKDWIAQNNVDLSRIAVVLIRDGRDEFLENLNVVVDNQEIPLNEQSAKKLTEMVTQQYASMGMQVESLQSRIENVGVQEAIVLEYRARIPGVPTPLWQRQVMMSGGGKLYIVTCTAKADTFSQYKSIFDEVLASFRVPPLRSAPGFDWNRMLMTGVISGAVGGLIGGLGWVVKKLSRSATPPREEATDENQR